MTVQTFPSVPTLDNPWISFDQNRASLFAGGSHVLKCHTWGIPSPAVKWMRNGQELKDGDLNGTISLGEHGVVGLITIELHFSNVQSAHNGNYTCESRNKYNTKRLNLTVLVSCTSFSFTSICLTCCLTFKAQLVAKTESSTIKVWHVEPRVHLAPR